MSNIDLNKIETVITSQREIKKTEYNNRFREINNYDDSNSHLSIEQHQAFIKNVDDPLRKIAYQKNLDLQKKLSTPKT